MQSVVKRTARLVKTDRNTQNYLTLQKSYRTTIEIMDLANELLGKLNNDLPAAEPVIRHGEKPALTVVDTKQEVIAELVRGVNRLQKGDLSSIAIIGKTEMECKWVHKELKKQAEIDAQILRENDSLDSNIIIVPSYLSKGLEFDAVVVVCFDEVFEKNELDIKLLYVAMTRAMHSLTLIGKHPSEFHLDKEDYNLIHYIKKEQHIK
ncbi:3'-5' exonuclease [Lentibacillus salinarum]|uniref:3'-5' exonuclease n=1 Tax=Lentibacillus salinarum TaxID=446820 RepID=A0ABW3ZQR6_9BACI